MQFVKTPRTDAPMYQSTSRLCYVVLISRFIEARSHDAVTQFPPWRRLSGSTFSVWNSNNTSSRTADVTNGYSYMRLIVITSVKYIYIYKA